MNREEIITKIQNDINKFYKSYESIGEDERELLSEIFDDVEKLRVPITLAEFLGWEDDVDYKCYDDKFIIMDNQLYIWNYAKRDWIDAYSVSINRFEQLREAEKIKSKNFYAKIKGWEVLNNRFVYWNLDVPNKKLIISSKGTLGEIKTKFTKEEWKDLGITEKNADFEEAGLNE